MTYILKLLASENLINECLFFGKGISTVKSV